VRFSSGINRVSIVSSFYRCHTAGAGSQRVFWGSIGNRLIRRSKELAQVIRELHTRYPGLLQPYYARQSAQRAPTSLISLVSNPLLDSLAALPIWVPFYSIIGDRGFGGGTHSSNGVVPYSSSHLNGAESEKIAPAGHEVFTDEAAVAEGSAGKSDETEAWPGSHQKQKNSPQSRAEVGILRIEILPHWMPYEHPPVDPHTPGIVNLLARASLTWLKTLEIVVSMAALSSARLFPGGNLSSTTGFPPSS
jgi:hypothetical protein